jgi:hypothetical protein
MRSTAVQAHGTLNLHSVDANHNISLDPCVKQAAQLAPLPLHRLFILRNCSQKILLLLDCCLCVVRFSGSHAIGSRQHAIPN